MPARAGHEDAKASWSVELGYSGGAAPSKKSMRSFGDWTPTKSAHAARASAACPEASEALALVSSQTSLPADALTAWTLLRRAWLPHALALLGTIDAALQGCLLRAGGAPTGAAQQPLPDVMWMIIGVSHR